MCGRVCVAYLFFFIGRACVLCLYFFLYRRTSSYMVLLCVQLLLHALVLVINMYFICISDTSSFRPHTLVA